MKKQKLSKEQIKKMVGEYKELQYRINVPKSVYERVDEITLALIGQDLSGYGLAIVDNFKTKNVAFKWAAVRRYELKEVE